MAHGRLGVGACCAYRCGASASSAPPTAHRPPPTERCGAVGVGQRSTCASAPARQRASDVRLVQGSGSTRHPGPSLPGVLPQCSATTHAGTGTDRVLASFSQAPHHAHQRSAPGHAAPDAGRRKSAAGPAQIDDHGLAHAAQVFMASSIAPRPRCHPARVGATALPGAAGVQLAPRPCPDRPTAGPARAASERES